MPERSAAGPRQRRKSRAKPLPRFARTWRLAAAIAITALSVSAWQIHRVPPAVPLAYLLAGMLSFALYGIDKRRAETGGWRIEEALLYLVDLAGGIGGGVLAQLVFRHKTSKLAFVLTSASFAALHVVALLLTLSPLGAALLAAR